jgi:hypothetical protein
MIGHLYYLIGLSILLISFSNIIYYQRFFNILLWTRSFKKISGSDPISKDFRTMEDYNIFITFNSFEKIEFIWFFFGLITNSWIVFLALIGLSFLSNIILNSKLTIFGKFFGLLIEITKTICIFILIINHFHIHLDWLSLI